MQLRKYQEECIEALLRDLKSTKNAFAIAPTGAGKTVILCFLLKKLLEENKEAKVCILQGSLAILEQNLQQLTTIMPGLEIAKITGFCKEFSGQIFFSMAQTLHKNLHNIPRVDYLLIDEAHHSAAETYGKIIDGLKEDNPSIKIVGVTATALRGDKVGLFKFFNKISYEISSQLLIDEGYLVPPEGYILDSIMSKSLETIMAGKGSLSDRKNAAEDKFVIEVDPEKVVSEWERIAGDRPTVVFSNKIAVSQRFQETFAKRGYKAFHVDGSTTGRQAIYDDLYHGNIQVLCNVGVLTEGWNCPPVSCIALTRACSSKTALIQMVGRGLRTHEGKTNCLVLDFGISLKRHKNFEQIGNLRPQKACLVCKTWFFADLKKCPQCGFDPQAPLKTCPECDCECFANAKECPECGLEFKGKPGEIVKIGKLVPLKAGTTGTSQMMFYKLDKCRYTCSQNLLCEIQDLGEGAKIIRVYHTDRNIYRVLNSEAEIDSYFYRNGGKFPQMKHHRWIHEPATPGQINFLKKYYTADLTKMTKGEATIRLKIKFLNPSKYTRLT